VQNVGLDEPGPADAPSMEGREEHLRDQMEADERVDRGEHDT
jgi:hypothetical protein